MPGATAIPTRPSAELLVQQGAMDLETMTLESSWAG